MISRTLGWIDNTELYLHLCITNHHFPHASNPPTSWHLFKLENWDKETTIII